MPAASIKVDTIAATSIISACETGHAWQLAVLQLRCMTECGSLPDVVSCGAVLSACEKGCQWSMALSHGISSVLSRSTHAQNSCLAAAARATQWRKVLQLSQALWHKRGQLDVLSCGSVLHSCDVGSRWQRALNIFFFMELRGPRPNIIVVSSAISAVSASMRGGAWALQVLADLPGSRLRANAICCNAAVSTCAASSMWAESVDVFSRMLQYGPAPTMITHGAVMSAAESVGRWHDVLQWLSSGKDAGLQPTFVTCSTALSACRYEAAAWAHGVRLMACSREGSQLWPPTQVVANALVGACSLAGRWRFVAQILNNFRGWVLQPDHLTLASAASALRTSSDTAPTWAQTLDLLKKFSGHALQPDYSSLEFMLSACAHRPARATQQMALLLLSLLETSAAEALGKRHR